VDKENKELLSDKDLLGQSGMSSDEDVYRDNRRASRVSSHQPPSGFPPASPIPDDHDDQRSSGNGTVTANDIANSDERVKQILYSDVRS
jgi:hypothetical protein